MKKSPPNRLRCKYCGEVFIQDQPGHEKFCKPKCYYASLAGKDRIGVDTRLLIDLHAKGWSVRRIAGELNIPKSTVFARLRGKVQKRPCAFRVSRCVDCGRRLATGRRCPPPLECATNRKRFIARNYQRVRGRKVRGGRVERVARIAD